MIPVKGDAPTSLYGGGAVSRDDCVRKQAGDSFRWKGSGQITWKVQVDRAGDYEVVLNHAAEPAAVGQRVQVSSGGSRVEVLLELPQLVTRKACEDFLHRRNVLSEDWGNDGFSARR